MKRITLIFMSLSLLAFLVGCAGKKALKPAVEQPKTETETKTHETTPEPIKEEPVTTESEELAGKVELQRIHFEFDKYRLTDEAKDILAENARALKNSPNIRITIEGHCDERGTAEYNLALGERRAQTAKNYLMELGVPENRIQIISYGKERPMDMGHSEDSWAKNRRDDFIVMV